MKKKFSKEKVFEILKYVCIGLAIIVVVGLVGSLFTRSDGDGVRVPTYIQPEIKEPVIKTFVLNAQGTSVNSIGTFSYEEGMTWADWMNSKYNTIGLADMNEDDPGYGFYIDNSDCICLNGWSTPQLTAVAGFHTVGDCVCGESHEEFEAGRPLNDYWGDGYVNSIDVIQPCGYYVGD